MPGERPTVDMVTKVLTIIHSGENLGTIQL